MDISCLDHAKFQEILLRAKPLVVNNVHHIMQGEWTPEYFVQRFGSQEVMITDCETNYDYSSTISEASACNDLGLGRICMTKS
jgi:hypothetical protein